MARKRERDGGGHPLFWLLLGFICGVMAMLGGLLLLLNGEETGDSLPAVAPPEAAAPALNGAPLPGGPVVLIPPPSVEPLAPIQEPVVQPTLPTLPTFRPDSQAAPAQAAPVRPAPPVATKPTAPSRPTARPRPPAGRSSADQMAEDAAASGMTARTR
jgi:hypothetical protein